MFDIDIARTGAQPQTAFFTQLESADGLRKAEVTCAKCNLRETCLFGGAPAEDLERLENIVYARRRIRRGEPLFRAGDPFSSIYAIRRGSFKTSIVDRSGREQITGFFINGELLGLEGLGSGRCEVSATALEDSEICAMPHSLIEDTAREVPSMQRRLHSVLAREIMRGQGTMLLLGSMCAEERLAAFLLNLAMRFQRRGNSSSQFALSMSRDEIGSYLGLKMETVSRLFSKFRQSGLIAVRRRQVSIIDILGLERVLETGGRPRGLVRRPGKPHAGSRSA